MTDHKLKVNLGAIPSENAEVTIDGVRLEGCIRKIVVTASVDQSTTAEIELVGVQVELMADVQVKAKIVELCEGSET